MIHLLKIVNILEINYNLNIEFLNEIKINIFNQ